MKEPASNRRLFSASFRKSLEAIIKNFHFAGVFRVKGGRINFEDYWAKDKSVGNTVISQDIMALQS